jgi:hypothetical protein
VTGWRRPDTGTYPLLTLASGTSVNIPAGQGVIVPPGADGADNAIPVAWGAQSVTLVYLATNFSTTLAVSSSGVVTQFAGRIPSSVERSFIVLGTALHLSGTVTSVDTTPAIFGDNGYLGLDTADILTNILVSGGDVTANGANLLLNVTNGLISRPGGTATAPNSPNTLPLTGGTGINFRALAGTSTLGSIINTAPVASYDPNGSGVVTALPTNSDCTIHRLYYLFGSFIWVYGQYVYSSVATALNFIDVDRSKYVVSQRLSDATLIAEIISTKINTDLSSASAALITVGGPNFIIGGAGGIGEAPIDGNTYGRRNATWNSVISGSAPNMTGDVTITKATPKVIEVMNPVSAGYAGLNVKQLGFDWCNLEITQPDDKTYLRSYNPATGVLRNSTTWDLATGNWTFPAGITATGNIAAATFNGAALPSFGTAASANVTTSAADVTSGRVWRTNDLVKQTSATDATVGSALLNGAFGLGGIGVTITNANTLTATGFYKIGGADTGIPVGNTLGYNIYHQGNATSATQLAISYDNGAAYIRTYSSGTPTPWQQLDTTTPNFTQEKIQAAASATVDITGSGSYITRTVTGANTWTFNTTGLTAGYATSWTLELTNGGTGVQTFTGVKWAGGTAPTLTAAGVDVISFTRANGITRGFLCAKDSK